MEEQVEQVRSAGLAFGLGVVSLDCEDGEELRSGGEERAGRADGVEGAVELVRPGAVAGAEVTVVFAAQPCGRGHRPVPPTGPSALAGGVGRVFVEGAGGAK